jgi:hypothetical protein
MPSMRRPNGAARHLLHEIVRRSRKSESGAVVSAVVFRCTLQDAQAPQGRFKLTHYRRAR